MKYIIEAFLIYVRHVATMLFPRNRKICNSIRVAVFSFNIDLFKET